MTGDELIRGERLTQAVRGVRGAARRRPLGVAAGEIVAIMGPSGSGKSTLLHCLAAVLQPDSGEVVFDGRRIDRLRSGERARLRREQFGFVFQFGQLVPELSARENVDPAAACSAAPAAVPPGSRPTPGSTGSGCPASATACPASCPAARPSGSRSRGR